MQPALCTNCSLQGLEIMLWACPCARGVCIHVSHGPAYVRCGIDACWSLPARVGLLNAMILTVPWMPEAAKAGPLQDQQAKTNDKKSTVRHSRLCCRTGNKSMKHNTAGRSRSCENNRLPSEHESSDQVASQVCGVRPAKALALQQQCLNHAAKSPADLCRAGAAAGPYSTHQSLMAPIARSC
jgi:hypothetical protein